MPVERRKDVLHSWKDIAAFLQRGVRTVQRWEQQHQLPVHRVGRGARRPTFAFRSELNAWLVRMSNGKNAAVFGFPQPRPTGGIATTHIQAAQRLEKKSRELREQVRQSREALHSRMNTLQGKVKALLETGQAVGKNPDKKGPGPAAA